MNLSKRLSVVGWNLRRLLWPLAFAAAASMAVAATPVTKLSTLPLADGSVQVSWDAPAHAEGQAMYEISYTMDLVEWIAVENPTIVFSEGRAIWIDTTFVDIPPEDGNRTRIYRARETFPIADERITPKLGQEGPIPLAVLYAPVLPVFEPDPDALARSSARFQLSVEQDLDFVLGEYIVVFHDDVFAYQIAREDSNEKQLVTTEGVALETLAAELVAEHGGEILAVWESALYGFAAYLPPPAVDALKADSRIKLVEGNGIGTYDNEPQSKIDQLNGD